WIFIYPILTPFKEISGHVVQPERIGRKTAHRCRFFSVQPFLSISKNRLGTIIRFVARYCFAEEELRRCPSSAGIFPFCFRWQAIRLLVFFLESFAKNLAIVPRNAFDGEISFALESTRIGSHRALPLLLGDKVHGNEESFGQRDL